MYLCSVVHNYNTTTNLKFQNIITHKITSTAMKRISLLLLTLSLAICVNAQLLWKVTGNGLSKPSYLFGTHHVAPISVLDNTPGFNEALKAAEQVYGEVDMSFMTDPAMQMKLAQYAMAPADSTLSKVMSAKALEKIDSLFAAKGLPVSSAQLEMMKPAAVSNTLTMVLAQEAIPEFNPMQQIDQTIQTKARQAGKEVKGLETVDAQMKVLFGSPISSQAEALEKILDNPAKAVELTRALADAYLAANLAEMEAMISNPDYMSEEEAEEMLNARNSAWIEVLMGALPTASVLVVVGAGHLPGDKGLIKLLRNAGYVVEPVNSKAL